MKKFLLILFVVIAPFCGSAIGLSCNSSCLYAGEKDSLIYKVRQNDDWVFYGKNSPEIEISVKNPDSEESVNNKVTFLVSTDKGKKLYEFSQGVSLSPMDSTVISFGFDVPSPGFYKILLKHDGKLIKKFNIGFEPEKIISPPDPKPDFREFWDKARTELASVDPQYKVKKLRKKCGSLKNVYLVTMRSLGGVEISGYYVVPKNKGVYPVVVSYMGYGAKPWCPDPDTDGGRIWFVLSVRGQGLNQPGNIYGDWITYGLGSRETYYYRGAYMDLIRAIDFVCTRKEADKNNIFVEGGSQGGAFTFAACALDHRIAAGAPSIPFLSDFRDYFSIVPWPGNNVLKKCKEIGMSDEKLYDVLSYFDIKNLAGWIKCPIIMASGLQDGTCPPHINFAAYNQVVTHKMYYIFPNCGHSVPVLWYNLRDNFFKKYTK
ncbi:MAG: acetylxylan esterase [Bacteroidales bacterium]|jgi:cephalosporin-C deacetylase|nr:acetylxylan esterase [Bacteroidales bacterium]